MRLVSFTNTDKTTVYLNPEHVVAVEEAHKGTRISVSSPRQAGTAVNGCSFFDVTESLAEVVGRLTLP